jgi:hypothetical protein
MLTVLARVGGVLAIWLVAGALLFWGRLPGAWRRALALATSAAGLVFLSIALNTEGLREAPTRAKFLVGPSYVTAQVSASASLPYYVMTAVCLLLGTAGLAVGDEASRKLRSRWIATAVALSVVVTLVRYWLERVAAPASLSQVFGVIWLAPAVGAFFLVNVREQGQGLRRLIGALVVYALLARGFVALTYLVATTLQLGSHYDISSVTRVEDLFTQRSYQLRPGSPAQLLTLGVVPQFTFWPIYTVVTGLMGAGVAAAVNSSWRPPRLPALRGPVERVAGVGD